MIANEPKMNTTILLLISDRLVRSVISEILEHEGYVIMPAGDLGSAVDWLERSKPDLLITRTYVSSMPGHEAAKYLRKKCHSMRVLILGGLLDDDRLQHRESLAGFAVFPKPYTATQLIAEVKKVLTTAIGGTDE